MNRTQMIVTQPLFASASVGVSTVYSDAGGPVADAGHAFSNGLSITGELRVTAGTGTVTGTLQTSHDGGATWTDIAGSSTAALASGASETWSAERVNDGLGDRVRYKAVIAGAATTFEASARVRSV